ncbi:DUF3703 domain-containing protein [Rheinheimera sp.]|uniref:DUF3703 domain-containing protein n=1 Tax=Rheinheimera sp. TaxID=1869214 RepID=UPI00307E80FB
MLQQFEQYLSMARQAEQAQQWPDAWRYLEYAHICGQRQFRLHWQSHRLMLCLAWRTGNVKEGWGQLLRLVLTPLGHLLNRLPEGNPGTSRVSAFKPQPLPAELQQTGQSQTSSTD